MKVGDLVIDVDPYYSEQLGIIVKVSGAGSMYEVLFNHGPEWISARYLDIVSSF